MSMRRAASWCQPLQEIPAPLGALMLEILPTSVISYLLETLSTVIPAPQSNRGWGIVLREGARSTGHSIGDASWAGRVAGASLVYDAFLLEVLGGHVLGVLLLDIHLGVQLPHGLGVEARGDLVQDALHLGALLQDIAPDDGRRVVEWPDALGVLH